MNKTLITAATFAACAAMQLPAQSFKEGVITFSLTTYAQNSVSTSKTVLNAGRWSQRPQYYKTTTVRRTTTDVLKAISVVLHYPNSSFYSSKAQLVLVQGELGGFFNMAEPGLPEATATVGEQGVFDINDIQYTPVDGGALFVALATGRHILPVPEGYDTTGAWPPGHHQPWGQIYVKDPGKAGYSASNPFCENVTFFFAIMVEECYDCYYLNSFITDTSFNFKQNSVSGPPCCGVPESLLGNGKDKYYMQLSFDNTSNNPYLNPQFEGSYVGWTGSTYEGIQGIDTRAITLVADGITPDFLPYIDNIASGVGRPLPYEMRFTLQGIMTYTWNLKFINPGDAFADFVGTAKYDAKGYGFIALRCSLLEGSVGIAESIKKAETCCLDLPWYDWWYGIGWNQPQSPWDTFGDDLLLDVAGFGSPINTEPDLSFHTSFDQQYYPGWEWGSNPTFDALLPTQEAGRSTFVPIWSAPTLIPNTDKK
jgi:hypothetical protein